MAPNQPASWAGAFPQSLEEAQHAFHELRRTIDPVRRSLEQLIGDHPVRAGALSLALGVLLGWLIKR